MSKYNISLLAQDDIRVIYSFIAKDSTQNADRVLAKLIEQFKSLAETPGLGHTRRELDDDTLRVISVYSYLVIYDPARRPLEIVRVIHGAMELGKAFKGE
jgi:plasmid stabilization system protein ParE